ncbi:hypothetical protein LOTGIDRAFT_74301, partial [Lottia gigantea]
DILKLDLYGLLEVEAEATKKEILSAYRKKARKCHPDKNPDNPKAAELFLELAKALEVLTDAPARAAYDKAQQAKKAAEVRHRQLDSKRKKFKEDLEAREENFEQQKKDEAAAQKNLQAEIERLRKEGCKLLEEEQELLKESIKQEKEKKKEESDGKITLAIVKWKSKKDDQSNGGYNENNLEDFFSKYGDVSVVLVSKKKTGSAIIEFSQASQKLLDVENETGSPQNQLTVNWLSGKPKFKQPKPSSIPQTYSSYSHVRTSDLDFESLVLMKMRQAEERKRLIEQMKQEDEE